MRASVKTGPALLSSLTSMRFFAAIFVVVHHVAGISGNLLFVAIGERLGWLGVSFFFILSGFVLMWSFDAAIARPAYILRRLSRIYPLHFICLCLSLAYFVHTGRALGGYVGTGPGTVANFLLVQDWIPGHPDIRQAWNGVSWTLSCEFFFYLLAPLCFPFFFKVDRFRYLEWVVLLWCGMVIFSVAAQANHWNAALDFYLYHPLPRATEFFLGALGARWIKAGFRFPSTIASLVIMLLPVLIYCAFVPEVAECPMLMNLLFVPGAFLLILAAAGRDIDGAKSWLHQPLLVRLGDASFALYMTHAILLGLFVRLISEHFRQYFFSSQLRETVCTLAFLFAAVVLSLAVHYSFELPARKFLLSLFSPRRKAIPYPNIL